MKQVPITSYTVLGQLPNPFIMDDGTPVTAPAQWPARREELRRAVVDFQYGTLPPAPEFLEVQPLYTCHAAEVAYRIVTGRREKPIAFKMVIFRGKGEGPRPAVVDGDLCFAATYNAAFIEAFTQKGVSLVLFDRTELAVDWMQNERVGQVYDTYPECSCGSIGAWAWGFSRCVDALEQLDLVDLHAITFAGHSRGGKTALLAGALDERAAIVCSNASGRGGSGCYRVQMEASVDPGMPNRDERLSDAESAGVLRWYGPEMDACAGKEADLPFDQHYLKAMVAPRVLVETEAGGDIWCNTVGTWQTAIAAREVYRFLGAPQNQYLYFRDGYHAFTPEDVEKLISVIHNRLYGTPVAEGSFELLPFSPLPPIFDWVGMRKDADSPLSHLR